MGCSDGRFSGVILIPVTDPLSAFESLSVSAEKADKVIRKYSPSPFVSSPQFATIVSKLGLSPLSPRRAQFYSGMQSEKGFNRMDLLVSGIMQGTVSSRETQFRLLFEVIDVGVTNLVKSQKFAELVTAMVNTAIVFPLSTLKPDSPSRPPLEQLSSNVKIITRRIVSHVAVARDITYNDLERLLLQEGWRDIAFPAGLRKLASSPELLKDGNATEEQENGSMTTSEDVKPKRTRHRKKTEIGQRVSEHIRTTRSLSRSHTLPP